MGRILLLGKTKNLMPTLPLPPPNFLEYYQTLHIRSTMPSRTEPATSASASRLPTVRALQVTRSAIVSYLSTQTRRQLLEDILPGLYVRVLLQRPTGGDEYRIAPILGVTHGKIYRGFAQDTNLETTMYLVLPLSPSTPGASKPTPYELNSVSNKPFQTDEFGVWHSDVEQGWMPRLPSSADYRRLRYALGRLHALKNVESKLQKGNSNARDQENFAESFLDGESSDVGISEGQTDKNFNFIINPSNLPSVQASDSRQCYNGAHGNFTGECQSGQKSIGTNSSPVDVDISQSQAPSSEFRQGDKNTHSSGVSLLANTVGSVISSLTQECMEDCVEISSSEKGETFNATRPMEHANGNIAKHLSNSEDTHCSLVSPTSSALLASSAVTTSQDCSDDIPNISDSEEKPYFSETCDNKQLIESASQNLIQESISYTELPTMVIDHTDFGTEYPSELRLPVKTDAIESARVSQKTTKHVDIDALQKSVSSEIEKVFRAQFFSLPLNLQHLRSAELRELQREATEYLESLRHILEEQSTKCITCMSNSPGVIFLPCKHKVLCKGCCTKVGYCPMCRVRISEVFEPVEI